jgi:serine/threonine protein kinase
LLEKTLRDSKTATSAGESSNGDTAIIPLKFENVMLGEKLAETGGSNATVYRCYVNGWLCAVKMLPKSSGIFGDPTVLERFLQEITLIENLPHHRNIVRYLFHDETSTHVRLYMTQYSASLGSEIRHHAQRNEKFTTNQISSICTDVIKGLEFLHSHGIVHRDLKSDNIFIIRGDSGIVSSVIGDFDTAKDVTRGAQAVTMVGTPAFIAPEVLQGDEAYTFSADIYSFGMIVFELIARKLPYMEVPVFQIHQQVLKGVGPALPADLDRAYEGFVQLHRKCTTFKPEARPSLREITVELSRLSD